MPNITAVDRTDHETGQPIFEIQKGDIRFILKGNRYNNPSSLSIPFKVTSPQFPGFELDIDLTGESMGTVFDYLLIQAQKTKGA